MSPEGPGPRKANEPSSESTSEQAGFGQEYEDYAANQNKQLGVDPDVVLDIPVLNVDEIDLEVDDLRAHVSLRAELADLVKVNVGVDIYLDKVKLVLKGVEAQALLKVKLEGILKTLDRALDTIDRNPQILDRAIRDAGQAVGGASQEARESEQNVGSVLQLEDVAAQVGETTQKTGDLSNQVTGQTADEPGWTVDGSGDAVETPSSKSSEAGSEDKTGDLADLRIEEEYIDEQGRIIGRARDESGNVVEEVLDEEGESPAQDVPEEEEGREPEEDIEVDATEAARRKAGELGVKLSDIKGTGSSGRVLIRDVKKASRRVESTA